MFNNRNDSNLSLTVVVYKNQARKIIDAVSGYDFVDKIIAYQPDPERLPKYDSSLNPKLEYSSDWSESSGGDVFFISSPSNTHVPYIEKILSSENNGSNPYVYCEKPPGVTIPQIDWLESRTCDLSKRTSLTPCDRCGIDFC